MSTPSDDAQLNSVSKEQLAALAELYDRFAHALDPFSEERDEAEINFNREVAYLYDSSGFQISQGTIRLSLQEFRKGVIVRCKRILSKQ